MRLGFGPHDWDLGLKAGIWASRLRYGPGGGGVQRRRRRRRKFPCVKTYVTDLFGAAAQKGKREKQKKGEVDEMSNSKRKEKNKGERRRKEKKSIRSERLMKKREQKSSGYLQFASKMKAKRNIQRQITSNRSPFLKDRQV